MSFSSNSIATAQRMLQKFGESVTFTRVTKGAYDPATGGFTEAETTHNLNCHPSDYDQSMINDDTVQAGDIMLMVEYSADYQPATGDKALFAGEQHFIVSVPKTTRAQGADIYYTVQIRK